MIREMWELLLRRTDRNWVRRCEVTWQLLRDFLWGWPMCRWGGKDCVSSRVCLRWSPRNLVQVVAGRVIACRSHKAQVEFWRQPVLGILEPTKRQRKGNSYPWVLSDRNGIWGPEEAASSPQSALHSAVSKRHLYLPDEKEWWLPQNRWHQNGPDYVRRCKIHYRSMRGGKRYPMAGPGTINWQLRETVILESHFPLCIEIKSSWAGELNVFFSNLREFWTTSNPTRSKSLEETE